MKSMHHIMKGASIGVLGALGGYVIMFFFKLILARHFGAERLGQFELSTTILLLLLNVVFFGIPGGISRFIPLYQKEKKDGLLKGYLLFIFLVPVLSSLVLALILFFLSDLLAFQLFHMDVTLASLLKLVAILLPIRVIKDLLSYIFLSQKRVAARELSLNIVERGLHLLFALGALLLQLSLLQFFLLYIVGTVLTLFFECWLYEPFRIIASRKTEFSKWFLFSFPLFFTSIFVFFVSWTDNLIIGARLTAAELGIYAIVYSLAKFLNSFQGAFTGIFLPVISGSDEEIAPLYRTTAAWAFGLTVPLALVLIFYGKNLIKLVYGAEYIAGMSSLVILSIGMLLSTAMGQNSALLTFHGRTKIIFIVTAILASMNIIATYLLVPFIGIMGAALSSALTLSSRSVIFYWIARSKERLRLDWIYMFKFVASGLIAIFLSTRLLHVGLPQVPTLMASGLLYGALYIAFLLLFRTFGQQEDEFLELIEKRFGIRLTTLRRFVRGIAK